MEKSKNYPDFDKINTGTFAVYLNDPNRNLLPEIEKWCKNHNLKIDNDSVYKEAIRIVAKDHRSFPFHQYKEVFELFSL